MSDKLDTVVLNSVEHGATELARVDYLDGWRGVAILLVLYAHFLAEGIWIGVGRLGVDIFFVLSGLLMSRILFVKRVPLPTFYKRRVSRVLPAFLLFVVVISVLDFLWLKTEEWRNFFSTVLFLRTYIPEDPGVWQTGLPIGHLWSLNVEEHCYLFLSIFVLFKVFKGREGVALIVSGVLCILIHILYMKNSSIAPPNYNLRTEVAASHLLLSAGYYLIRHHFVRYVQPWMPLAAVAIAVLCYIDFPWWGSVIVSPFMLAFAVNHLSETYKFVRSILSFNILRLMGIWSYSIYLWQQPFFVYKDTVFFGGYSIVLAIIVGVLSFYYFENPIRAYINKRWK